MSRKQMCLGLHVMIVLLCVTIVGSLTNLCADFYEASTSRSIAGIGWIYVAAMGIAAVIAALMSSKMIRGMIRWSNGIEKSLRVWPAKQLLCGILGLIAGLVVASLVSQLFRVVLPRAVWLAGAFVVYLVLGSLGALIGGRRWQEIFRLQDSVKETVEKTEEEPKTEPKAEEKAAVHTRRGIIVDTSILIDGRILDVCRTGFVPGPLLIPQFVLKELQNIADQSDQGRRGRGRRGLDVVAQLQQEEDLEMEIVETDFPDLSDVDSKLLKLSKQTGAAVMTNDFNLTKVAGLAQIRVYNLNQLASALRMVIQPGEELKVQILKEGKEVGQGVGYMTDGTMIVVDGGKPYIGETVTAIVTTALQTSAGRMVFSRIMNEQ